MAVIYLRSTTGNDANDGSGWALAKATLAAALTAAGAGGTVYVSQVHAETQASAMTLTSPGTAAAPVRVLCVNDSSEPPTALATLATVSTTGASSISFIGYAYSYGITYSAGSGTNQASISVNSTTTSSLWEINNGKLTLNNSNAASRVSSGSSSGSVHDHTFKLVSSPIQFGHASQAITTSIGRFVWLDTASAVQGTAPSAILNTGSYAGSFDVTNVDLSAIGSGKALVLATATALVDVKIANCKLGASVSALSGAITAPGSVRVAIDNCDSGDTNYRMEHYKYQGSIKTETVKVRTGGASDGTTPISWNMTSLAGASFVSPLDSPPMMVWNETTGSAKTVTVEILHDSVTDLTDEDIWVRVDYLGTSGYPLGTVARDRKADILAAPAAQDASSATWTTTGLTNPRKQKLAVTFTPQGKGPFQVRVMLAKPSYTVYVCPKVEVS